MKILSFAIRRNILLLVATLLLTAVVYSPTIHNDFVGLDDTDYVLENDDIKEFNLENIKNMFGKSYVGMYCPLTIVTFAVEHHFFKEDPFIYHLDNYLLHLANTFLVFIFLWLLTRNSVVSFVTALIFGVHTVHVESVAWVSERKDVLYAFFFMLSLIAYLMYLRKRSGKKYYLLSVFMALLSFLSKSMAVTLPLVMFLVDYYELRKFSLKLVLEKTPFIAMAFLFSLISLKTQYIQVAIAGGVRFYYIVKVIPFYISKILVPLWLSNVYGYIPLESKDVIMAPVYILAIFILVYYIVISLRKTRKILFGFGLFLVTLLPVLQLIPAGDSFAADRFLYIPSMGLFFLMAVGVDYVWRTWGAGPKTKKITILFMFSLWIIFISTLTYKRIYVWKSLDTLYREYERITPYSSTANYLVGISYDKEDPLKAAGYYENAIALEPTNPKYYHKLGEFYLEKEMKSKAAIMFKKAVAVDPRFEASYLCLGKIAESENDMEKAARFYREAMLKNPDAAGPYVFLARLYSFSGRHEEAIVFYEKAVALDPKDTMVQNNLGYQYSMMDRTAEAVVVYRRVLRLDPKNAIAMYNLGTEYKDIGKIDEAIVYYTEAAGIDGDLESSAYENLHKLYLQKGDSALAEYYLEKREGS